MRDTLHIAKTCASKETRAGFRQVVTFYMLARRLCFYFRPIKTSSVETERSAGLLPFPLTIITYSESKRDKMREEQNKGVKAESGEREHFRLLLVV